jgi:hypothetical protein
LDLINPGGWLFPLILKATIFSALLVAANFSWLAWILFVGFAFYFYFRPPLNNSRFFYSFFILFSCSLIILGKIGEFGYRLPAAAFFGVLFFMLLGIKNLAFINRQSIFHAVNGFLLLSVFLCFFSANKSEWFALKYLLAGAGIFLIIREFLKFFWQENKKDSASEGKSFIFLSSFVSAFLAMEVIWAIALLPMGFLNSSAFALVFILILEDFLLNYSAGSFNTRLILRNVTVFTLLTIAIFAASSWSA